MGNHHLETILARLKTQQFGPDTEHSLVAIAQACDSGALEPAERRIDHRSLSRSPQNRTRRKIGAADEISDIGAGRAAVDFCGRSLLLDPAIVHHDDFVGEGKGLLLIMRYMQKGHAEPTLKVFQLDLHILAHAPVERRKRLVQKQKAWLVDDGASERHALLLPAGKLAGAALRHGCHLHLRQRAFDARRHIRLRKPAIGKTEADIFLHRKMREERIVLKDGVDRSLAGGNAGKRLPVEFENARRERLEATDHPQQGCLAAAGGSEQGHIAVGSDAEVHTANGMNPAIVLVNGDALKKRAVFLPARILGPICGNHDQLAFTSFQSATQSL